MGPNFAPPAAPPDKSYDALGDAPLPAAPGEPVQRLTIGQKIAADWWTLFQSPAINETIAQALAGSPDLAAAKARLTAAQEIVAAARGGLLPQVDVAAAAERQRQNYAAFGLHFPPAIFNTFSVGPAVSYSIDPFGKVRRLVEEREAQAAFADYELDASYLALTGTVVSDALTIAALDAQIRASEEIVAEDDQTLGLVRQQAHVGIASDADVARAEAQLAGDRMALPPLRHRMSTVEHALSILTGRSPAEWTPPRFTLESLTLPGALPLTLPSQLVRNRPDILAAEAELHAASAAIGVATAAEYPDITLSASATQIALETAKFFTTAGSVWNVAAGVTAPVFHGGALAAERRAAEDDWRAAAAVYRRTVLQSFAQVADVLDGLRQDTDRLGEAHEALDAARHSLDLAQQNYATGNSSLIDLLDAERLHQRALLAYAHVEAQRYLDTAALFIALGGGWWEQTALAPPRP
jgi:NodT family efflux transporter outer membrane factor (OMF) lipoprotein